MRQHTPTVSVARACGRVRAACPRIADPRGGSGAPDAVLGPGAEDLDHLLPRRGLQRALGFELARMVAGAISGFAGGPNASTASGASSFSAQNDRSFEWLPRSLIVPLPKSHHRYHFGPGT